MTRVDFYISEDSRQQARELLACRIIEKAWQQKTPVYVHTDSPQQAAQLDSLLWTYRDQSFIPHACMGEQLEPNCQVILGHQEPPDHHNQVLVNLCDDVPMFFSRFDRVIELIHEHEPAKQKGRERYKFYKDRGYALATHTIKN